MAILKLDKEITALLVIDPYNDFTSERGTPSDSLDCVLAHTPHHRNQVQRVRFEEI